MRILHVFNHSVPHTDGYCVRSLNILRSQRNLGLDVVGVTSPHHEPPTKHAMEEVEGFQFHRCEAEGLTDRPVAHELQAIRRFSARIRGLRNRFCRRSSMRILRRRGELRPVEPREN